MTSIARNGIGGLALRLAAIAFAVLVFGCAPKETLAQTSEAAASQPAPAAEKTQ
jgi:hypothetical protein